MSSSITVITCPICKASNAVGAATCVACGVPLSVFAAPASVALPVGSKLAGGSFTVGKVLGQGGFGITYLGGDTRLRRPVAIKEFFPQGCGRSSTLASPAGTWSPATFNEAKDRFLQEGQVLARFSHPHIVRVLHAFEENGTAYIVMDFLRGQTLGETMAGGRLEENEAIRLIGQVGEALEEVHAAGLLHRDLKPDNILVCPGASGATHAVLIDFGTAREFAADKTHRMTQMLTVGYAPLEQYSRTGRYGPYTDVYALAATLYHLVTGEVPQDACARVTGSALVPPRQLNGRLSQSTCEALEQGLAVKATERPQTVREFLSLLSPAKGAASAAGAAAAGSSAGVPAGPVPASAGDASSYRPRNEVEKEVLRQLRGILNNIS